MIPEIGSLSSLFRFSYKPNFSIGSFPFGNQKTLLSPSHSISDLNYTLNSQTHMGSPSLIIVLLLWFYAFIEGPPFTLQRICMILLAAGSIYPNLSKLALALGKNLLVTSTITTCSDPYPQTTIPNPSEQDKASKELQLPPPQPQSQSILNGVEPTVDRDGTMTEVEEAEIDRDMSIDMDSFQEMVESSERSQW